MNHKPFIGISMTAQIDDLFNYNEKQYHTAGFSNGEPFNPENFRLFPRSACTGCDRGYFVEYALDDCNMLLLKDLQISLYRDDEEKWEYVKGKSINGISPYKPEKPILGFNNYYENINLPMSYTGGILIASDFIHELYVHMGFHPALKYKQIFELIFKNGCLESATDRSVETAGFRSSVDLDKIEPGTERWEEIMKWILQAFSRRYS